MAATCELKIYTGASAGTESPAGDATNWNLMSSDAYDSTGTTYQSNPIVVPAGGTAYSYERWMKLKFSGTFNLINNVKVWKSAGTLSDAALSIYAGKTATGATPVATVSSIATATIPTSSGTAINITPSNAINTTGEKTDFLVVQLRVPSTVVTPGDIGTQTLTFQYDES